MYKNVIDIKTGNRVTRVFAASLRSIRPVVVLTQPPGRKVVPRLSPAALQRKVERNRALEILERYTTPGVPKFSAKDVVTAADLERSTRLLTEHIAAKREDILHDLLNKPASLASTDLSAIEERMAGVLFGKGDIIHNPMKIADFKARSTITGRRYSDKFPPANNGTKED